MIKQKKFKIEIAFIISFLIISGIFYYSGCSSTSTGPGSNTTDPNIVKHDSIKISPYLNNSPKSFSAVDLYLGTVLTDSDRTRDMNMRDSAGIVYYFRSGDTNVTVGVKGYATYFELINYGGPITRAQFDTITVIPGGLTGFQYKNTYAMGCFNYSKGQNRVFAYYLEGKNGVVTSNPVYGLIYLEFGTGGPLAPVNEYISLRLNKGGVNKFK